MKSPGKPAERLCQIPRGPGDLPPSSLPRARVVTRRTRACRPAVHPALQQGVTTVMCPGPTKKDPRRCRESLSFQMGDTGLEPVTSSTSRRLLGPHAASRCHESPICVHLSPFQPDRIPNERRVYAPRGISGAYRVRHGPAARAATSLTPPSCSGGVARAPRRTAASPNPCPPASVRGGLQTFIPPTSASS